jgi:uncharacterized protein YggE
MKTQKTKRMLKVAVLTIAAASALFAAARAHASGAAVGAAPEVVAAGTHELSAMPDAVRASTTLQEKGTDVKALLSSVRKRAGDVQKSCVGLGAAGDSVKIGEPIVTRVPPDTVRQFSALARRLKSRAIDKAKLDMTVVSIKITARFLLTGTDVDAQLTRVAELSRKILDASRPATPSTTADGDDEEDDETAQLMRQFASTSEGTAGTVETVYVKRFDDGELARARKAAFDRARAAAEDLARAAGMALGPLRSVREVSADGGPDDATASSASRRMRHLMMTGSASEAPPADAQEVTSDKLRPLRHPVSIQATFELKPPGP